MNLVSHKIDLKVIDSIASVEPMKLSNTQVTVHDGNISVSLHGNTIMKTNHTQPTKRRPRWFTLLRLCKSS